MPPAPIDTVSLFPLLDQELIALLRSLKRDDWYRPTLARLWTVKDIAAHLLDGNMRTLSLARDGQQLAPDIAWKLFTKGMSPVEAEACSHLEGPDALTAPAIRMVSVMA